MLIFLVVLIALFALFVPVVFLFCALAESATKKAKGKAREVLAGKRAMSKEHIGWLTEQMLAASNGDIEAADLWRKLRDFTA